MDPRLKFAPFIAVTCVAVAAAFLGGVYVGVERMPAIAAVQGVINKEGDALSAPFMGGTSTPEEVDFMPFWRTWNTLERKFVPFGTTTAEAVSDEKKVESAIQGLVASYHDPYTVFFPRTEAEAFKTATRGSLEGIGAIIGEREGALLVVAPLPDSPAALAGLEPGDELRSIDAVSTAGFTVEQAVELIRGPSGTTVELGIVRGEEPERKVGVTRGTIVIPSTATAVVTRAVPKYDQAGKPVPSSAEPNAPAATEERDFFVLKLVNFSQTSVDAFRKALETYRTSGADTLIIDLRGNPGGYVEAAVEMASWFLPEGAVVVREYSGPEKKEKVHRSYGRMLPGEAPVHMTVLVDRGTASAAEILAAALRDHGLATIVGTRTFGKGSVQELIDITPELALKVTVARWYTPNGVSISDGGILPDVEVSAESIASATSTDPWLDAAVTALGSR